MTKKLIIGNEEFLYPVEGDSPISDWGNSATDWATAVTDVLGTIYGPNDISLSTYPLANNIITPTNIVGLKFSTTTVLSAKVEYTIKRVLSGSTITEYGVILGTFDGIVFSITQESVGDAGVSLDVTNAGQFQYTSSNMPTQTSMIIKFKATTIAQ